MKRPMLGLILAASLQAGHINALCIGQSNMCGAASAPYTVRVSDKIFNWSNGSFSPIVEPSLAAAAGSPLTAIGNQLYSFFGDTVYLINAAISGSGLHSGHGSFSDPTQWNLRGAGTSYQKSIDSCTKSGMVPDVVFMIQGNTDIALTDSANYSIDMNALAADYRTSFNKPTLPIIIAQMGYESGSLPTAIRAAQLSFGHSGNINNRTISGLEQFTFPADMSDVSHYRMAALEIIGRWLALEYIKWCHYCP